MSASRTSTSRTSRKKAPRKKTLAEKNRDKGPQVFQLEKGLEHQEAYRRAKNRATRDFRGFAYDRDTGVAKLI